MAKKIDKEQEIISRCIDAFNDGNRMRGIPTAATLGYTKTVVRQNVELQMEIEELNRKIDQLKATMDLFVKALEESGAAGEGKEGTS